jgi:ketosteroid isomerase-like protein
MESGELGQTVRNAEDEDLLSYLAIRRHLESYMSAIDRRDFEAVAACFTENAEIRTHVTSGDPQSGEFYRGGAEFAKGVRRLEKFKSTNHSLANALIEVNGRTAKADCRVTAWLMGEIDGSDRVFLRCIHVIEDLVLMEAGWKICKRLHMPMIQFEVPSSPIFMPHRDRS